MRQMIHAMGEKEHKYRKTIHQKQVILKRYMYIQQNKRIQKEIKKAFSLRYCGFYLTIVQGHWSRLELGQWLDLSANADEN